MLAQLQMVKRDDDMRDDDLRWKAEVDAKLDKLLAFSDEYEPFLKLAIEREEDRKRLRRALIEKGYITCLIFVVGIMSGVFYDAFKRWVVQLK